jgi:sugar lactone lactonase YvrE
VIRRVNTDGTATVIAGIAGQAGDSGDGGPATQALLSAPVGLALAADGTTLYFSDRAANRIRKLVATGRDGSGPTYTVYAVAGSGATCSNDTCGDGPDPLAAQLGNPEAIWVDPVNNVYIADTQNNRVRVAIAAGGVSTIQAGSLLHPAGITGDAVGNLYVSDTDGAKVVQIKPGSGVRSIMGTGVAGYNGTWSKTDGVGWPGPAATAKVNKPRGLATNLFGQLFVVEAGNRIVRNWDPGETIILIAGLTNAADTAIDTRTFVPDGSFPEDTAFKLPNAIAVTKENSYVVTDAGNFLVRAFGAPSF